MSGMEEFRYDLESTELTDGELASFCEIVLYACLPESQNRVSCFLSLIGRPQGISVLDFVSRQVEKMWRTDIRVLAKRTTCWEVTAMNMICCTNLEVVP